ncbi:hypothetical protein Nepgr_015755 [Nepenthes gracilis]|uniref:Uncharacterized protein n=1 Tax=Nepenthes gracilis TaxID=150966 RepID=A0AAD3SNI9_NEPGR|nr:hypothetical protein Nepgr_015755 [Nepenthes gracilis]
MVSEDAVEDAPTVVATPCPHAVRHCFELEDVVAEPGALKLAQNAHLASMSLVVSKEQLISSTPPGQAQAVAKGLIMDVIDPANSFATPLDSVVAPISIRPFGRGGSMAVMKCVDVLLAMLLPVAFGRAADTGHADLDLTASKWSDPGSGFFWLVVPLVNPLRYPAL